MTRATDTIKLYKNVIADKSYEYLPSDKFNLPEPSYTMQNTSFTDLDQPIRFKTSEAVTYDDLYECNYLSITRDSTGVTYYAFIDDIVYENDAVSQIYFTLDFWRTYNDKLDFNNNIYIERTSTYSNDDKDLVEKNSDNAFNQSSPIALKQTDTINTTKSPYIIIYTKNIEKGKATQDIEAPSVSVKWKGTLKNKSYDMLKRKDNPRNKVESLQGSYVDHIGTTFTGGDSLKFKEGTSYASSIKAYAVKYNEVGQAKLFNNDNFWNTNGSSIISAEIRQYIPDSMLKDLGDGLYSVTLGNIDEDFSHALIRSNDLPSYLRKSPHVLTTLNIGGSQLIARQEATNDLDYHFYDSTLPNSNPRYSFSDLNGTDGEDSLNSENVLVDTQNRSIDLYVDGVWGYYYGQRHRLNAKITNFINSNLARIANFSNTIVGSQINAEQNKRLSLANLYNGYMTTLETNKYSQTKQTENLENNQNLQTSTLDNNLKTQFDTITNSNDTSLENATKLNKIALDNIDTSYDATFKNLENSKNTRDATIDANSISSITQGVIGALGPDIGNMLLGFMHVGIDGAINNAASHVINDIELNGIATKENTGSRTSTETSKDAQKQTTTNSQNQQIDNLKRTQTNTITNFKLSRDAQYFSLRNSQKQATNSMTNGFNITNTNINTSNDTNVMNTTNGLNQSIVSMYNSLVGSSNTLVIEIMTSVKNFNNELQAEFKDYQGAIEQVSGGNGYNYISRGLCNIYVNLYEQPDYIVKQIKEEVKNKGLALGAYRNLNDYIYKNHDNDFSTDKNYYNMNTNYIKTQNLWLKGSAPQVAIDTISQAFNNGCYILS